MICTLLWLTTTLGITYYQPIRLNNTIKQQKISLKKIKQQAYILNNLSSKINDIKKISYSHINIITKISTFAAYHHLQTKQLEIENNNQKQNNTNLKFMFSGSFQHIKELLIMLYKQNIALDFNHFTLVPNHDKYQTITFSGELSYETFPNNI